MPLLDRLLAIDINYIVAGLIVFFYSLEYLFENPFRFGGRGRHLAQNVAFFLVFAALSYAWAWVAVACIEWLNAHQVGLLYLFSLPLWAKLLLGVALFDFTNYWFHRTAHRVPLLWRFHRVHHSDPRVDASTNLRGHPVEFVVYFGISNILAAGVFGLDLLSLGLFFLIVNPIFFLEHFNVRSPRWMDKTIGLVFNTPNFHKVHHDRDQHYTDSNYADIFILWDRLFGTFRYKELSEIRYGLQEFDEEKQQGVWYLLKSPFLNIRRTTPEGLDKKG